MEGNNKEQLNVVIGHPPAHPHPPTAAVKERAAKTKTKTKEKLC